MGRSPVFLPQARADVVSYIRCLCRTPRCRHLCCRRSHLVSSADGKLSELGDTGCCLQSLDVGEVAGGSCFGFYPVLAVSFIRFARHPSTLCENISISNLLYTPGTFFFLSDVRKTLTSEWYASVQQCSDLVLLFMHVKNQGSANKTGKAVRVWPPGQGQSSCFSSPQTSVWGW